LAAVAQNKSVPISDHQVEIHIGGILGPQSFKLRTQHHCVNSPAQVTPSPL